MGFGGGDRFRVRGPFRMLQPCGSGSDSAWCAEDVSGSEMLPLNKIDYAASNS